jgi:asparagine synthase (glutamine-hydrolysing)
LAQSILWRKSERLSGIAGIFNRDGAPVSRPLLQALTNFQAFRGPDAQEVWLNGSVGFGHTMLRTTREAAKESQPASLDNRYWITADVRLDSRADLIKNLQAKGEKVDGREITDPGLLLHAYRAWGDSCVDYLRGDFAFAIWDAAERELFCARDHFGIKPFFYVVKEKQFLFSNTLNCLRAHPDVSEELNDAAIGDFLLFGLNCEIATTAFCDIQRLPPAHLLSITPNSLKVRCFWSPPTGSCIRYKRDEEYVEQFCDLFKLSVADRLRTSPVGLFLSGGLDSGAIAAMANEVSRAGDGETSLYAYTMVFESLFRDEEGEFAAETARHLGVPIEFLPLDDVRPFDKCDDYACIPPEPADSPFFSALVSRSRRISSRCRVILSGDGGDNLTRFQMWPYAKQLLKGKDCARFLNEGLLFLWRRKFPWRGARSLLCRLAGQDSWMQSFPEWVASDFCNRLELRGRWMHNPSLGNVLHPTLPDAYASLTAAYWKLFFEAEDPGVTGSILEVRYPFLDLRIVSFFLSLPSFPWLFEKSILRKAMLNRLPSRIRTRPKMPLSKDFLTSVLRGPCAGWMRSVSLNEKIRTYVDANQFAKVDEKANESKVRSAIRVICLNFWLQSQSRLGYKIKGGGFDG